MKDLNDLSAECSRNAYEHGWHDKDRSFGDVISLIHSELSEALEDYRDGKSINEVYWEGEKPCGIPVELADVLIRIFDFCGQNGINIQSALEKKMKYNKTRPYRHGGKAL